MLISGISTMVNGTLLNFGKRYEDDFKGHFLSVAKVALRFGCAKQSKNLERYLLDTTCLCHINFEVRRLREA